MRQRSAMHHARRLQLLGATLLCAAGSVATAAPVARTAAEVIKQSAASDWRAPDAEHTLVMELRGGVVMLELAPRFAPLHVANILKLARNGYYTGSAVVRVQDNYVAQWADPSDEDKAKPLGDAAATLPAEFSIPFRGLAVNRMPDADGWAPVSGFVQGLPVAADPRRNRAWIAHCYGVVGAARGNPPDSSNGTSLYAIIGQAPRGLDLNITVVGRVLQGMELLSALPRGPGPMGFYDQPAQHVALTRVRVMADMAPSERPALEVLRTDTRTWAALVESARNPGGEWFARKPGRTNLCNRSVPTRPTASGGS